MIRSEQLPHAFNHKCEEPSLYMLIASASRSIKLPILTQHTFWNMDLLRPDKGQVMKCVNSTFRDHQLLQTQQHVQLMYKSYRNEVATATT